MNYFEKEELEKVLEAESFILARKGQKLAVCWGIRIDMMCMIRDLENGSGVWVPTDEKLENMLFARDGELKHEIRNHLHRLRMNNSDAGYGFPKFLKECLKHFEKEDE